MILFITAFVPACVFYIYAMMNFHRELWKAKRLKSSHRNVIQIRLQERPLRDRALDGVVVPNERYVPAEPSSGGIAHNWRQARLTPHTPASPEVCQFESAYIGPLFLVSLDEDIEAGTGCSRRMLEKATARHAL